MMLLTALSISLTSLSSRNFAWSIRISKSFLSTPIIINNRSPAQLPHGIYCKLIESIAWAMIFHPLGHGFRIHIGFAPLKQKVGNGDPYWLHSTRIKGVWRSLVTRHLWSWKAVYIANRYKGGHRYQSYWGPVDRPWLSEMVAVLRFKLLGKGGQLSAVEPWNYRTAKESDKVLANSQVSET